MSSEIHFACEMRIPALSYYPRRAALEDLKDKLGAISWEDPDAGIDELDRYVGYVETDRPRDGGFSVIVETYREQFHAVGFVVEHPLVALLQDFDGPTLRGKHLDRVQALPRVTSVTVPWSAITAITRAGADSLKDSASPGQVLADTGVPGFPTDLLPLPSNVIPAGYVGSGFHGFPPGPSGT